MDTLSEPDSSGSQDFDTKSAEKISLIPRSERREPSRRAYFDVLSDPVRQVYTPSKPRLNGAAGSQSPVSLGGPSAVATAGNASSQISGSATSTTLRNPGGVSISASTSTNSVVSRHSNDDASPTVGLIANGNSATTTSRSLDAADADLESGLSHKEKQIFSTNQKVYKRDLVLWLLKLAGKEFHLMIVAAVTMLFSSATNLALPSFAGRLLDGITSTAGGSSTLENLVLALFGLAIVTGIISFVRTYFVMLAAERVVVRLNKQLFGNLVNQEIGFFDLTPTGELLNRLSADVYALKFAVTTNVESLLRHSLEILGCACILLYTSVKLCLVIVLVVPLVGIGAVLYSRFVSGLSKNYLTALAGASHVAEETFGNVRTVRALGQEDKQRTNFEKNINISFKNARRLAISLGVQVGSTIFIGTMAVTVVLWFGGSLVIKGDLSVGVLTSFLLYTAFCAYSLSALSQVYFEVLRALGAAEKIYILSHRKPLINISGGERPEISGHIEFHNVTFSYPSRPEHLIINNMDIYINVGEVTALVGPSGGGKSTVASLILRFYDAEQGDILLDGVNIRDIEPSWMRKHISVVSQEPVLFATSIRENIAFACPNATNEDILRAAEEANALDFIRSFPRGFDTVVGERGAQLSGGYKQRIAIARALLQQPKLLILDEATSALDSANEQLVQAALDKVMKGRTTIVIAHRLSTVENANKICVVKDGKVIEEGTHKELIARPTSFYADLVRRQMHDSR